MRYLIILAAVLAYAAPAAAQCAPVANLTATRIATGVLITWEPDPCAERVYFEASRGTADQIIEDVAPNLAGYRNSFVMNVPRLNTDWRIAARAFSWLGVSSQVSVVLREQTNDCTTGIPAPTLLGAQVSGPVLSVYWAPDPRCVMTHYTLVGSNTPTGPSVGSIDVPGPATRAWSGAVPSGTYYVRVYTRYHDLWSAPSAAVQVTIP